MKNMDLNEMQNIDIQDLRPLARKIWNKSYRAILVLFWMAMIAVGAYFWYLMFYGPGWSEAEKEQFLKAKFPENNLNREALEKVLEDTSAKKERFEKEVFTVKNIFKEY